jgi:phytoene dehydrogenase-like protein
MKTIIVGGGIGGLATALALAQRGIQAAVFERSAEVGGRARTRFTSGFAWNFGPHALYPAAAARLESLGIRLSGGIPPTAFEALFEDALHPLSAKGMLFSSLLKGARLAFPRWYLEALRGDVASLRGVTVEAWLAERLPTRSSRLVAQMLIRTTSYCDDPRLDAATAALSLRDGTAGVRYLDGGWQRLVDALRTEAERLGVVVTTNKPIEHLCVQQGAVTGVILRSGEMLTADAVVLAVSPREAETLLGGAAQARLARARLTSPPLRAACLDLALSRVPCPSRILVLGVDRPVYLSVHSAVADLAPKPGAVVHVAKYLTPGQSAEREELEGLLDRAQPGWRSLVVDQRYLPSIEVAGLTPTAELRGTLGRPSVRVAEVERVFLVGDWVGEEGILGGAALSSALTAAQQIAEISGAGIQPLPLQRASIH